MSQVLCNMCCARVSHGTRSFRSMGSGCKASGAIPIAFQSTSDVRATNDGKCSMPMYSFMERHSDPDAARAAVANADISDKARERILKSFGE